MINKSNEFPVLAFDIEPISIFFWDYPEGNDLIIYEWKCFCLYVIFKPRASLIGSAMKFIDFVMFSRQMKKKGGKTKNRLCQSERQWSEKNRI